MWYRFWITKHHAHIKVSLLYWSKRGYRCGHVTIRVQMCPFTTPNVCSHESCLSALLLPQRSLCAQPVSLPRDDRHETGARQPATTVHVVRQVVVIRHVNHHACSMMQQMHLMSSTCNICFRLGFRAFVYVWLNFNLWFKRLFFNICMMLKNNPLNIQTSIERPLTVLPYLCGRYIWGIIWVYMKKKCFNEK